jgi:hypothetical protein
MEEEKMEDVKLITVTKIPNFMTINFGTETDFFIKLLERGFGDIKIELYETESLVYITLYELQNEFVKNYIKIWVNAIVDNKIAATESYGMNLFIADLHGDGTIFTTAHFINLVPQTDELVDVVDINSIVSRTITFKGQIDYDMDTNDAVKTIDAYFALSKVPTDLSKITLNSQGLITFSPLIKR